MIDGKPKVLLTEDDPFMASLIGEAFEKAGFTVVLAGDGEDAVAKVKAEKPDVAVMDILLPKKTGIEATREIRSLPEGATLPIIIISNLEDATYVTEAEKLNVKAYLVKANMQIPDLVTKAQEALNNGEAKPTQPRTQN